MLDHRQMHACMVRFDHINCVPDECVQLVHRAASIDPRMVLWDTSPAEEGCLTGVARACVDLQVGVPR